MTGVTILETVEIYTLSFWQFVLGFMPLIIAAVVAVIHMCYAYKKGTKSYEILYAVVGGILSLALLFSLQTHCPADYVETRYKVTVDETTLFVEFNNKYEVIEEKPDYFLVRERGDS